MRVGTSLPGPFFVTFPVSGIVTGIIAVFIFPFVALFYVMWGTLWLAVHGFMFIIEVITAATSTGPKPAKRTKPRSPNHPTMLTPHEPNGSTVWPTGPRRG